MIVEWPGHGMSLYTSLRSSGTGQLEVACGGLARLFFFIFASLCFLEPWNRKNQNLGKEIKVNPIPKEKKKKKKENNSIYIMQQAKIN